MEKQSRRSDRVGVDRSIGPAAAPIDPALFLGAGFYSMPLRSAQNSRSESPHPWRSEPDILRVAEAGTLHSPSRCGVRLGTLLLDYCSCSRSAALVGTSIPFTPTSDGAGTSRFRGHWPRPASAPVIVMTTTTTTRLKLGCHHPETDDSRSL